MADDTLEPLRQMQGLVGDLATVLKEPVALHFCKYDTEEGEVDALSYEETFWIYQGTMERMTIGGLRPVPCWIVSQAFTSFRNGRLEDACEEVVGRFQRRGNAASFLLMGITKGRLNDSLAYMETCGEADGYSELPRY